MEDIRQFPHRFGFTWTRIVLILILAATLFGMRTCSDVLSVGYPFTYAEIGGAVTLKSFNPFILLGNILLLGTLFFVLFRYVKLLPFYEKVRESFRFGSLFALCYVLVGNLLLLLVFLFDIDFIRKIGSAYLVPVFVNSIPYLYLMELMGGGGSFSEDLVFRAGMTSFFIELLFIGVLLRYLYFKIKKYGS